MAAPPLSGVTVTWGILYVTFRYWSEGEHARPVLAGARRGVRGHGAPLPVTPVRRTLSVLVLGAGALVVVLCGRTLVVTPQLVAENPPPAPGQDAGAATALVIFPLVVSAGLLGGMLLIWSGVRGVRSADRPVLWRARQRTALWGCAVGTLLAAFIYFFGGAAWTGLPRGSHTVAIGMVVFYSVMGFLLIAALALQNEREGLNGRNGRNGRDGRDGSAARVAAPRRRPPSE